MPGPPAPWNPPPYAGAIVAMTFGIAILGQGRTAVCRCFSGKFRPLLQIDGSGYWIWLMVLWRNPFRRLFAPKGLAPVFVNQKIADFLSASILPTLLILPFLSV